MLGVNPQILERLKTKYNEGLKINIDEATYNYLEELGDVLLSGDYEQPVGNYLLILYEKNAETDETLSPISLYEQYFQILIDLINQSPSQYRNQILKKAQDKAETSLHNYINEYYLNPIKKDFYFFVDDVVKLIKERVSPKFIIDSCEKYIKKVAKLPDINAVEEYINTVFQNYLQEVSCVYNVNIQNQLQECLENIRNQIMGFIESRLIEDKNNDLKSNPIEVSDVDTDDDNDDLAKDLDDANFDDTTGNSSFLESYSDDDNDSSMLDSESESDFNGSDDSANEDCNMDYHSKSTIETYPTLWRSHSEPDLVKLVKDNANINTTKDSNDLNRVMPYL